MKKINFVLTFILVLSIATCCVISSAMIAWSQSSGPGESTYNYTLVSTAAYCDVDAIPFTGKTGAITGNLNSRILANDTEFKAISASDDSRWKTSDPGYGDEVFMWFQQTTDEYAPGVKQIDLTFEGYLDTTATFQIRAYNNNTGAWDQIGTTMSIPSGSDSTMTRSITSNCDDYIDSTNLGMLNWGVYAAVTDQMNIDYVQAVVSYATWDEMNQATYSWMADVWGSSSSDIFAVGAIEPNWSPICHYNGVSWTESYTPDGRDIDLYGVWGAYSSNVFAVGTDWTNNTGIVLHYDGNGWGDMYSAYQSLYGIWGTSPANVYACGDGGTILHYNGSEWCSMESYASDTLWDIWGSSNDDVFAIGADGTILHYNGSSWSSMDSGTSATLWGIWGISPSDIFVTGDGGSILHYNGSSWSSMDSGTTGALRKVWGTSPTNVYTVGEGEILHYNGNAWSLAYSTLDVLLSIWGASPSDITVVGIGSEGGLFLHYDGILWSEMDYRMNRLSLGGIWGNSSDDIYISGGYYYGSVMHYDGSAWHEVYLNDEYGGLVGVWGSSASDVFVVGEGANPILHYDGWGWNTMDSPDCALYAVWGNSSNDVFAAGWSGNYEYPVATILHYNGSDWTTMNTNNISSMIRGLWGTSSSNVFAVGENGVILYYNGSDWISMTSGTTANLFSVWGSSANNVYAVGDGVIMHFNGTTWSKVADITGNLHSIWGTSAYNIYAVGGWGCSILLNYNGTSWSELAAPSENYFTGVWGTAPFNVYFSGYNTSSGTMTILNYH